MHGVSRALKEEVVLNAKTSRSTDWESYQVLRFTEMPGGQDRADQPAERARRRAPARTR